MTKILKAVTCKEELSSFWYNRSSAYSHVNPYTDLLLTGKKIDWKKKKKESNLIFNLTEKEKGSKF